MYEFSIVASPDEAPILAVEEKDGTQYVLVEGIKHSDGEDIEECLVGIPRDRYLEMVSEFLDRKFDYCNRFNHWCGSGVMFGVSDEMDFRWLFCDECNEYHEIELYWLSKVELEVEHG